MTVRLSNRENSISKGRITNEICQNKHESEVNLHFHSWKYKTISIITIPGEQRAPARGKASSTRRRRSIKVRPRLKFTCWAEEWPCSLKNLSSWTGRHCCVYQTNQRVNPRLRVTILSKIVSETFKDNGPLVRIILGPISFVFVFFIIFHAFLQTLTG